MTTYGYARVSTIDQDLSLQRRTLKAAGCDMIRAEKASGTRRSGRTELQVLLDFLQPGDTLVVTRVDRLARSIDRPFAGKAAPAVLFHYSRDRRSMHRNRPLCAAFCVGA